jgi:DNA mismatch repair protein MutL
VLGTYIVAEYMGDVLLIDQHAAAEKVLYNRIIKQYTEGKMVIQPMLIPYSFTLNETEAQIIRERMGDICDLGIELVQTGDNCFQLKAIPALLVDMDIEQFIHLLLAEGFSADNRHVLHEKLAYTACRAAIKGNTYLDNDALNMLCQSLFGESLPAHCPHGRPAYVKVTRYQLEKLFKRIV